MDTTRMEPDDVQEKLEVPPETMEPSDEEGGADRRRTLTPFASSPAAPIRRTNC